VRFRKDRKEGNCTKKRGTHRAIDLAGVRDYPRARTCMRKRSAGCTSPKGGYIKAAIGTEEIHEHGREVNVGGKESLSKEKTSFREAPGA